MYVKTGQLMVTDSSVAMPLLPISRLSPTPTAVNLRFKLALPSTWLAVCLI